MIRGRPSRPAWLLTAVVAALLALHWWTAVQAWIGAGVTFDEPVHLTAGYSYWTFGDYRLQPENGILPQRWAALPLRWLQPRLSPAEQPVEWTHSDQWRISHHFLFESGNPADYLLLWGRALMACWSVAAGLLVFAWSRRLWGTAGGLVSLVFFVIAPTTLAHGALVTSDMCAAFCLLAAVGAWWRLLQAVTWDRLLVSALATSLAFVAKFSAVLLVPVFALLLVWRIARRDPLPVGRRAPLRSPAGQAAALALAALAHGVAAWAVIWTCFGWRFGAFAPGLTPPASFYVPTEGALAGHDLLTRLIAAGLRGRVLPEAYLHGFAHMRLQAVLRAGYLAGQYSMRGWWWFFPYAFLVKSTLGELLGAAALVVAAAARWGRADGRGRRIARDLDRVAPLLALAAVYGLASLATHLNIGHRHILPLYPVLFILLGALVRPGAGYRVRGLAAGLALLSAVESRSVRPHYLSFFNVLAGGPAEGWHQLVDSSFDWGQNLPAAAAWVRAHRHPGEPVYLAYFGTDHPGYEGLPAREFAGEPSNLRVQHWLDLGPGLYCISATQLQEPYLPVKGVWTGAAENTYVTEMAKTRALAAAGRTTVPLSEWRQGLPRQLWLLDRLRFHRLVQYLRVRRPDAVVGYNLFLYRLSPEEIRGALEGTPADLANLISQALEAP